MSKKRVHAVVHGRVQGVFFRDYTRQEATRIGLSGWVRNLPDGTVETEFEGDESMVKAMLSWLHEGSPLAEVKKVVSTTIASTGEQQAFDIRY